MPATMPVIRAAEPRITAREGYNLASPQHPSSQYPELVSEVCLIWSLGLPPVAEAIEYFALLRLARGLWQIQVGAATSVQVEGPAYRIARESPCCLSRTLCPHAKLR